MLNNLIPDDKAVAFHLQLPMYRHWKFDQMKSYMIAENVKATINAIRGLQVTDDITREIQVSAICDVLEVLAQAVRLSNMN